MQTAKPEALGFLPDRLARIDAAMSRYVNDGKIAGIVSLVARRGQVVHVTKCGLADIEAHQAMDFDTIFRIYSMTKPITSTAVMMLLEEGCLRLTDPIAKYLPAFADSRRLDSTGGLGVRYVPSPRPITIRDLLTHTAGLSYGFDENVYIDELYRQHVWGKFDTNPGLTLCELIDAVGTMPLAFTPGTQFRYSIAIDVLGRLVEVISGTPFADFLRQRIFEPLGMQDTDFWVTPEKRARFAATYGPSETGSLKPLGAPQISDVTRPTNCPSGGGGLMSTLGDYFRFAQMLLNKGELDGVRLLGRKTVEMMTTNHLPAGVHCFDNPAEGFGLGGSVIVDIAKSQLLGSVGNFGWGGAANTNFWIDPKEDLLGILMLQYMPSDTWPVVADFRNLVYQGLE